MYTYRQILHTNVHTQIRTQACMHTYIVHAYIQGLHTYIYTCTYTCIFTLRTYIRRYVHTRAYKRTHIRTQIHTYIHTLHIYIYIHKCILLFMTYGHFCRRWVLLITLLFYYVWFGGLLKHCSLVLFVFYDSLFVLWGFVFLGVCDQKFSYKHACEFGRLQSYGRLKLRTDCTEYSK
jgi:hypothetical protein